MPCPLKKEISKIVREEVFSELQRIHKEQKKWDLTPEEMDLLNMEDKAHHFRLRKDTALSKYTYKVNIMRNLKPKSYFKTKWYIREDYTPEPFPQDWTLEFLNTMLHINCYNSKVEALITCNKIRKLLNIDLLPY